MKKKRDLGAEILGGIQAIKDGKGKLIARAKTPQDVGNIRETLQISQAQFALLLGVSVRTLQEWEQHRREPSGPARKLLEIASMHPEILLEDIKIQSRRRKVMA